MATTGSAGTDSSPPASLLGLLTVVDDQKDPMKNVAAFVGNPFDFRRLSHTCKDMNKYFTLENDDIWRLSLAYKDPSDDDKEWGDYLNDDRLPRAWEKAMVKAVRGKRHDYLAIIIDFVIPGLLKLDMIKFIKKRD